MMPRQLKHHISIGVIVLLFIVTCMVLFARGISIEAAEHTAMLDKDISPAERQAMMDRMKGNYHE